MWIIIKSDEQKYLLQNGEGNVGKYLRRGKIKVVINNLPLQKLVNSAEANWILTLF